MYHTILPHPTLTPADAIKAHEGGRRRAEQQMAEAKTAEERREAQFWIDYADRNLMKWHAIAERGQR